MDIAMKKTNPNEEVVSLEAVKFNDGLVNKSRTIAMITAGVTAGIFGLDGIQGLLFYFF